MDFKANAFKVLLTFVDAKHLNEVQLCASLDHNAGECSAGWECAAGVRVAACRCVTVAARSRVARKSSDNYGSLSAFAHNNAGVSALVLSSRNGNNNRFFSPGMSRNVVEVRLECLGLYVVSNLLAHSTLNAFKKARQRQVHFACVSVIWDRN